MDIFGTVFSLVKLFSFYFQVFKACLVLLCLSVLSTANTELKLRQCNSCFSIFTHCLDQVPCDFKGAKHYAALASVILKISRTCNLEPEIITTTTSRTASTTTTTKPCPVCPVVDCGSCCPDCPECLVTRCDDCCPEYEECPECPPTPTCPTVVCPAVPRCPSVPKCPKVEVCATSPPCPEVVCEAAPPCPEVVCSTAPPCPEVTCATPAPCPVCEACATCPSLVTEKTEECVWGCPSALETCEGLLKDLRDANSSCHSLSLEASQRHLLNLTEAVSKCNTECDTAKERLQQQIDDLITSNR